MRRLARLALLIVAVSFAALTALAQEPPDAPKVRDDGGDPRVYFAHSYYHDHWNRAGLADRVSVHVQNFTPLLAEVHGNCSAVVLFMNGMPLKGLKPESCSPKLGHIRYRLMRTPEADDIWHVLLGTPRGFTHPVSISIGPDTQTAIDTDVTAFDLDVIPKAPFVVFIILMIFAGYVFVRLCQRTSLIRDSTSTLPPTERPYSLAVSQMAFWFFLVVAAYTFMWLINDELDTITPSVLALIGIGAATALGATVIDKSRMTPPPSTPTAGFLRDVLSDDTGISLHRFQMFVWTLVLGTIFIASVYKNLEMPDFSATLLGLMGISSGTYLGFKVPASNAKQEAPAPAPAPVAVAQPATALPLNAPTAEVSS